MKKIFTLIALVAVMGASTLMAQTDITPSRYRFSNLPVGPYSFDKQFSGANVPVSDADVLNHWNDGFLVMGNGTFSTSLDITGGNAAILNSAFQVFDMGGQVGKVLMMKGSNSTFPYGTPADAAFNPGWWDMSIFTDPALTPSVASMLPDGVTGETATPEQLATATQQATVRFRIVFQIHENTIRSTASLFKILGYTFTNNAKTVGSDLAYTDAFGSADCANEELNLETFENEYVYDETKWIACEYDFAAPEEAGEPLRFTLKFGDYGWAQLSNYTLLIKEISMIQNPTGDATEREEVFFTPDVSTDINTLPHVEALNYYVANGALCLRNVEAGEQVAIYSITGQTVKTLVATGGEVEVPLSNGIYVVQAGDQTAKVAVHN